MLLSQSEPSKVTPKFHQNWVFTEVKYFGCLFIKAPVVGGDGLKSNHKWITRSCLAQSLLFALRFHSSFANSGLLDPYGPHAPHPQHLTTLVPLPPSRACRTSNSLLPQKGQANNPLDSIRLLCVSRALMIQFSIQNSW